MAYCEKNNGNTAVVCRKNQGSNITILFSDSSTRPSIADVATAKLAATYDALIKAAKGSRVYPIKFKEFTPGENEKIEYTGQRENVFLRTKAGVDTYMIYDPADWDKYNLLFVGDNIEQEMYILAVSDKNYVNGIYDSTRTLVQFEYVKVTKEFVKGSTEAPPMLKFSIESLEPDRWVDSVSLLASFEAYNLAGLLDLDLQLGDTASTTVLTVDVFDKASGIVPIADLVTADFLVANAAGTPLVITAAYVSGGRYTLTGTFPTETICTATLNTPTIMKKLYEAYNILDNPIP